MRTAEGETLPLPQRSAALRVVQAVIDTGVDPTKVEKVLPFGVFRGVTGVLRGDDLGAALEESGAPERKNWFLDAPIHAAGKTWVVNSNRWDARYTAKTLPLLCALAAGSVSAAIPDTGAELVTTGVRARITDDADVDNLGMTSTPGQPTAAELCGALEAYREARQEMLRVLGIDMSNRDPLPEWSERIVTTLTGGQLAANRNQPGYDLVMPDGQKVQVRSLSNKGPAWVNEHHICTVPGADRYALVLFEAFSVTGVLLFPADLIQICSALGKGHPDQNTTLQFTGVNWQAIRDDPDRFRELGMSVWLPPLSG